MQGRGGGIGPCNIQRKQALDLHTLPCAWLHCTVLQVWGAPGSSTLTTFNPLSVYLSPTNWFLLGAPCTLNQNYTTTLKPVLIMCNFTASNTRCENRGLLCPHRPLHICCCCGGTHIDALQ
jgi:hypothetical protein